MLSGCAMFGLCVWLLRVTVRVFGGASACVRVRVCVVVCWDCARPCGVFAGSGAVVIGVGVVVDDGGGCGVFCWWCVDFVCVCVFDLSMIMFLCVLGFII